MSRLLASGMATMLDVETKWDHDTVKGIINGYCPSCRVLTCLEVNKFLYKSGMSLGHHGKGKSQ